MIVVGVLHFLPHIIQRCYCGDDSGRCVTLPSPSSFNGVNGMTIVVGVLHFLPHVIQRCYWDDDSGRCVALPSPCHSTVLLG